MKRTQPALKNWILIFLISILTILGPGKSAWALGSSWVGVDLPIQSDDWELNGVHFTSADEGWVVGWDNQHREGILFYYSFGVWQRIDSPEGSGPLYSVYFTSPYEGWAVGGCKKDFDDVGTLLHYLNWDWKSVKLPSGIGILRSVHFTSSNEGWAVGGSKTYKGDIGILLHYLNGTWAPVDPPSNSGILRGVHFTSPNEGWAVGDRVMLHYLNGTWAPVDLPSNSGILRGVHFTSPNEGWVVGDKVMLHFLNGTWTTTYNFYTAEYRGVHFVSPDQGFAVGVDSGHPDISGTRHGIIESYEKGNWKNVGIDWPPNTEWGRHNWELRGVHVTLLYSSSTPIYQGWAVGGDLDIFGHHSGILLNADFLYVAANPDLTGQWESLKQTCKTFDTTKCKISGSFIIQNTGNQKARSSSVDFYLSDDDQYDEGDTFLKRISTGPIKAGDSVVKKLRYLLLAGEGMSGKYIIAVIDPEDVVTESDETNNEVAYGPIP